MSNKTSNNFHPQAFLIYADSNFEGMIKQSKLDPRQNYTKVQKLLGSYTPDTVISKSYASKSGTSGVKLYHNLFNLETRKISALVPELRFFKVNGNRYTPFYFPVSSRFGAGGPTGSPMTAGASGIKSFSVNYEGTDPFTAPRYLTAQVSLFVDHLSNLFTQETGYARLADLFTISVPRPTEATSNGGAVVTSGELSRPIEVEATLGYAVSDINRHIFTQEEIDEIIQSRLSLRMNVFNHSINVNQDGTATIDIKYTARIASQSDRAFSVISSPVDLIAHSDLRTMLNDDQKVGDKKKKKKPKSSLSLTPQEFKLRQSSRILEIAEEKGKIKELTVKEEAIKRYSVFHLLTSQEGQNEKVKSATQQNAVSKSSPTAPVSAKKGTSPTTPKKDIVSMLNPGISGDNKKTLVQSIKSFDNAERTISYISFGDLVEAFFAKSEETLKKSIRMLSQGKNAWVGYEKEYLIFSQKSEKEKNEIRKDLTNSLTKMKNNRVILSNVAYTYIQPSNANDDAGKKTINIADIPISLETYQNFMYKKVMEPDVKTYTIKSFLTDSVNELLPSAFGEGSWAQPEIAPEIVDDAPKFKSTIMSSKQLSRELNNKSAISPSDIPSPQQGGQPVRLEDECDYFFIYQEISRKTASPRSGNSSKDSKEGIYHFLLGKDRGLIKNISFSRFDVKYAQEQLMTNQVGLYDELKMPYNANITMYGNNLFTPGSQIFINPSSIGFGNPNEKTSPAFRIGLGGYYTVLGVTTTITGGEAETVLKCSFGYHASDQDSLSPLPTQRRVLGDIQASSPSQEGDLNNSDPIPDTPGASSVVFRSLKEFRTKEGKKVLDDLTSNQIAMDFNSYSESNHDSSAPGRIPGVVARRTNENTGAKEYELLSGVVIEVSPDGIIANSSVTRQSERTIEELAIEERIGTNTDTRNFTNNRQRREAQRREYEPPEGKPS